MTVKTFTSTTLSAADTNEFLANAGLVYVGGVTVSGATPIVDMGTCFSSAYDNYHIVINNVQASADLSLKFYLGTNSTSGLHYGTIFYYQYTGSSSGYANSNGANSSYVGLTSSAGANGSYTFDLTAPNLAKQKQFYGTYNGRNYTGWAGGLIADSAQYTSMKFINETGNITAGTFRIYGYRQA
jgi:hypothetical protein